MNSHLFVFIILLLFILVISIYFISHDKNYYNRVYKKTNFDKLIPKREYKSNIPKVIIQTSKNDLPKIYTEVIKNKIHGYQYLHFKDKDILEFFKENPISDFKNIDKIFKNIKRGEHKADLFRYYYLYVKGGIYFDSDLIIYKHPADIVKDYDFVSVENKYFKWISQFFIASTPKHPIIYKALKNLYDLNLKELDSNYHLLLYNLYNIIFNKDDEYYNIHLYNEKMNTLKCFISEIKDEDKTILFRHFNVPGSGLVPIQYLY